MQDVSHAAAFENARLKLLADSNALRLLFSLRAQIADRAMGKSSSTTGGAHWSGVLASLLNAAGKELTVDKTKMDLPNSAVSTAAFFGGDQKIPLNDMLRVREVCRAAFRSVEAARLLSLAETAYHIAFQTDAVAETLFPDKGMVPRESIRFFHIDKTVVSSALDGMFSVGVASKYEEIINNILYEHVSDSIFDKNHGRLKGGFTGFVIHSSLLENWKDAAVSAFASGGAELHLFEMRELGGALRMYIFNGAAEKVVLREPPHVLCSGLTSDKRLMVKSNGKDTKPVEMTKNCFRQDGRTLSVEGVCNLSKAATAAQFGLDFLRTPEHIEIKVTG